jgi:molecular chaperone DnaJ
MNKKDYYDILCVSRESSIADIKKSYRSLAMKYHPDKNPGDKEAENKFKEAAEAYEILGNPEKRELYDRYGHAGLKDTGFSGFSSFEDIFSSFGDIFGDFFGFSGRTGNKRQRARKGNDLRFDVQIGFMEAAFGTEKEITVKREIFCKTCNGAGHPPDAKKVQCPVCKGAGQIVSSQGFFRISQTCPKCRGEGFKIDNPCNDCKGAGRSRITQEIKANIPAGIESGQPIMKPGLGDDGYNGGTPGDLYIVVHFESHEFFKRDGDNIFCTIPISFSQAALGADQVIPTIHGDKMLKIHPGTQTGEIFRMKDMGINNIRTGNYGDHYVDILIKTPTNLSEREKELFKELSIIQGEKVQTEDDKNGLFDKIGDAFQKFMSYNKETKNR